MPRLNIILLEQSPDDASTYRCVMWADVPAARQVRYANPDAVSAWPGATTADNAALKSGSVAESVDMQRVPTGSGSGAIQGFLQQRWQAYQAYVNTYNPWVRYGSTWDGTTWAMVNNG